MAQEKWAQYLQLGALERVVCGCAVKAYLETWDLPGSESNPVL